MAVGVGNTLGVCALKTAHDDALFSCLVGYGVCDDSDELAVVVSAEGRKTTSLGGVVLV